MVVVVVVNVPVVGNVILPVKVVSGGLDVKKRNLTSTMKQKVLAIGGIVATLAMPFVGLVAHAQSVPTFGTSDVAEANGPIWTAVGDIIKYYIATYGTLMLWIFGIIAVFVLGVLVLKKLLHF